jgi:hypothetical protein
MSRIPFSQCVMSVAAVAALSWSPVARGDAVVDWNAIAVDAIQKASPARPGPVGFLDAAVVQAAVYDAVQAIDGRYKPYRIEIQGASGSPDAAAAKAAHDVLVSILPAQAASLETTYRDYLPKKGLAETDPGVAVGQKAAAGIIALRANDGRAPNPPPAVFAGETKPGMWRPTTSYQPGAPASNSPMTAPWLGAVPRTSPSQGGNTGSNPVGDLIGLSRDSWKAL